MATLDVARQRMRRMGLLGPLVEKPVDVVRGHLAMQAQDFGPVKWSIGQRLTGVGDADIERKISNGSILRTHVMRPTWHLVARSDLRWLMALTGPRVQKGLESRYRSLGLDAKTRTRAETAISNRLEGGAHLTRKELGEALRTARIDTEGQRLPHLLSHCELESIVCSGGVKGKEQTYASFDERVPKGKGFDRDESIVELVRRYLRSHGPATLKDMSWWSGLTVADLKKGLEGVGEEASAQEVEGLRLWSIGAAPRGGTRKVRVQLLQAYDELIVGYTASRYLGDPRAAKARAAFGDRNLPSGVVMVGTRVAGHWRRSTKEKAVEVEVLLYEKLRGAEADALQVAADGLGSFLGRQAKLEVRRLS